MSAFKSFAVLTTSLLLSTTIVSTALAQQVTGTRNRTNSRGVSVTETRSRGNGTITRERSVTRPSAGPSGRAHPRPVGRPPGRRPHGRPIRRGVR